MCQDKTTLNSKNIDSDILKEMQNKLHQLSLDDLIELNDYEIKVKEKGRLFVRIISAAIDARLLRNQSSNNTFSKAI